MTYANRKSGSKTARVCLYLKTWEAKKRGITQEKASLATECDLV